MFSANQQHDGGYEQGPQPPDVEAPQDKLKFCRGAALTSLLTLFVLTMSSDNALLPHMLSLPPESSPDNERHELRLDTDRHQYEGPGVELRGPTPAQLATAKTEIESHSEYDPITQDQEDQAREWQLWWQTRGRWSYVATYRMDTSPEDGSYAKEKDLNWMFWVGGPRHLSDFPIRLYPGRLTNDFTLAIIGGVLTGCALVCGVLSVKRINSTLLTPKEGICGNT